jgi:hypothetical protein
MRNVIILFALVISMFFVSAISGATAPAREKGTNKKLIQRNVPTTVAFQRLSEPREGAFTMLVPRGWLVEGGIFRSNSNTAGGTANAIEAKCDIAMKSDSNGTVMLRRLPKINSADGPIIPFTHGPGTNYNGAIVTRMPTVDNYLMSVFKQTRLRASNIRIIQNEPLPKLVAAVRRFSEPFNHSLAQVGIHPPSYHAGFLIVEYNEGDTRFKELLYTILIDARASMGLWTNDLTTTMRAPVNEVAQWKPVLEIISNSIQLNPKWIAGELKGQGERAEIARKVMQDISRIDREIAAHRHRTRKEIATDQYLTLTGQNDYKNPYTGKVERDNNDWKNRWVNSRGEYIYSNDTTYNPNADPKNPISDYKLTRPIR